MTVGMTVELQTSSFCMKPRVNKDENKKKENESCPDCFCEDCDKIFEKVQGRYEFNVYHNIKEDVEDYLKNYNIQVISVSDENGDFCVVREVKGERK